jgi:hypothetical protein
MSGDGIKDAFPEVEALYEAAPSAASVTVQLSRNGQLADLTVFIPNCSDPKREAYTTISFLLLDCALVEYDVESLRKGTESEALRRSGDKA